MVEELPKKDILPSSYMVESLDRRSEPLIVDIGKKEITVCIWNVACNPIYPPKLKTNERIQPTICDPCKNFLLAKK